MHSHFSVSVAAPPEVVWRVLTDPQEMLRWMGEPELQLEVETTWAVHTPFIVRGFHHLPFVNRGIVLDFAPCELLRYNQLSNISRLPDVPESYTVLEFRLEHEDGRTTLHLTLSGFPTDTTRKHLELYWRTTILKIGRQAEAHS